MDAAHVWTAEEMVAEFDAPIAAAGETYLYSSPTYELLARAAEHVPASPTQPRCGKCCSTRGTSTGSSDRDPNTRRPSLGLFRSTDTSAPGRLTDLGVGGSIICISSATYAPGAGSVASDAPSLAAWVWRLFAGDIVSPESLGIMVPKGNGFAYGLDLAPYGTGSVGASGGKTGYGAQFTMFPEAHAVIVIFVNDQDFVVEPTVRALLAAATAS